MAAVYDYVPKSIVTVKPNSCCFRSQESRVKRIRERQTGTCSPPEDKWRFWISCFVTVWYRQHSSVWGDAGWWRTFIVWDRSSEFPKVNKQTAGLMVKDNRSTSDSSLVSHLHLNQEWDSVVCRRRWSRLLCIATTSTGSSGDLFSAVCSIDCICLVPASCRVWDLVTIVPARTLRLSVSGSQSVPLWNERRQQVYERH